MTSPSDTPEKVYKLNTDRMYRQLICLNPTHSTIEFESNEAQPKCPICGNTMVTVVKSLLDGIYPTDTGKE